RQNIERATNMARRMVCEYGMSERLGPRAFGRKEELVFLGREIAEQRNYSEAVAQQIDMEIKELIDNAFERAHEALSRYRDKLNEISEVLMREETIDAERFEDFFRTNPPELVATPALG
ncbi:MAG: cell division protein FtsH, partial [Chloroflexi bacterium]|nr:cell division protein FtsH [Chloroflexota bacterium]